MPALTRRPWTRFSQTCARAAPYRWSTRAIRIRSRVVSGSRRFRVAGYRGTNPFSPPVLQGVLHDPSPLFDSKLVPSCMLSAMHPPDTAIMATMRKGPTLSTYFKNHLFH